MTIIYVAEHNCECLAVTFKNDGMIRVQKLENVSDDKNIIYEVNPMEVVYKKAFDFSRKGSHPRPTPYPSPKSQKYKS